MANSIEIRVPFCDISFVKTVNRFNQMKKLIISKYQNIFKKFLKIPSQKYNLSDKKGFTIPWMIILDQKY